MVIQDSEKHNMLCSKCECLFSEVETYFANLIFHPYLKNESTKFDYDDKLFYFLTSVSWRSLYWDLLDFNENHTVGIDALQCLTSSEKMMRDFLLHKRQDIGNIENHVLFFDKIKEIKHKKSSDFMKLRPHETLHRGITSYTFCYENEETYGTITNMMGIVIFTFYHLGEDEKWSNTKIFNMNGSIEAKNQIITGVAGNEFFNIMETVQVAADSISHTQQRKIIEKIHKASDTLKDSSVYDKWLNDRL